ncbi:thaumatin-like protein 1 [Salvia divinorum]|uniref:Thaumatin-like protein 1 n=1 Tax=Salvia divinorum TaxID=28513 RepID=A0ABD1GNU8_SALDI
MSSPSLVLLSLFPFICYILTPLLLTICCFSWVVDSAVFTVTNNCIFTIWPTALTGTNSPVQTGFELPSQA